MSPAVIARYFALFQVIAFSSINTAICEMPLIVWQLVPGQKSAWYLHMFLQDESLSILSDVLLRGVLVHCYCTSVGVAIYCSMSDAITSKTISVKVKKVRTNLPATAEGHR